MQKCLDVLETIVNVIMGIMIVAILALTINDIIMRYVMTSATRWGSTLYTMLFVWSVFLGSAVAVRHNDHFIVDILINTLKPRLKKSLEIVVLLLVSLYAVFMIAAGYTIMQYTSKMVINALGLNMAYMYSIFIITGVLIIIFAIEGIMKAIVSLKNVGEETK